MAGGVVADRGPVGLVDDDRVGVVLGKDMAAGNSWKAWLERREKDKAATAGASRRDPDPHPDGR